MRRTAERILSANDYHEAAEPHDLPGAPSPRARAAWRFAERAHRGSTRRDGATPYVSHAVAVARELAAAGVAEDLVCAGYLHDVVEHEDVTIAEVAAGFGDRVAGLVLAVSDEEHDAAGRPRAWHEQKREAVGVLRGAHDDVVLLRAADLCANLDDLIDGHAAVGRAVWERYEVGASRQCGYYIALAAELRTRLPAGVVRDRLEVRVRALRDLMAADGVRPRGRFRQAGSSHES